MKILFLDLSTKSTGYAVGENQSLKSSGCIAASSREVERRIIKMRDQIIKIIKNQNINKIVMEQVRPEYNSHTYKILMWLQAIIVIAAYEINNNIKYQFIYPSQWRAVLHIKQGPGIKRQNVKERDTQYVKNKYNLRVNDDEADAICLMDAYYLKFDNEINWE